MSILLKNSLIIATPTKCILITCHLHSSQYFICTRENFKMNKGMEKINIRNVIEENSIPKKKFYST